jgi:hypothetical protein
MNFAKIPGMYVLSFNMERPMVYYQYQPQSKRYVDSSMIKVGKCTNIKTRMGNYMKTYGYREFEPPSTKDYWINMGFDDNYLRRCLGCDLKEPHHHVIFEYIKEVEFLNEQDRKDIEKEIKNSFREVNVFGEYYRKEAKRDLIEFLDKLILSYEEKIS